jgi:hypothetical protein
LRIEVSLAGLVDFLCLQTPLEELHMEPVVSGSLGGLSALHYLVQQAGWLRSATLNPRLVSLVRSQRRTRNDNNWP